MDTLVEVIRDLGHDVWIDRHHEGNEQWWNKILEAIAERDAFIPVYDINYDDSYPCCRELDYAVALQRQIIPVVYDTELPAGFTPRHSSEFNYVHYVDDRSSVVNLQKRLSNVVELPSNTDSISLTPGFPAPDLCEIFAQNVVSRPEQSEVELILSLDRIEALICSNFFKSDIDFLLDEHKRRGPQGEYRERRPDKKYADIKERLNGVVEMDNSAMAVSKVSARKSDPVTDAPKTRSGIVSEKVADQNNNPQAKVKSDKTKSRRTTFLSLLSGIVIGALVGGTVSPIFFSDTASLQNENDKLREEISALAIELSEQKSLVSDTSRALANAKASVGNKDSEISTLKEQVVELQAQTKSAPP